MLLKLQKDIAEDIDLKGVLFLIGVQELQMGIKEYSKEEKQDTPVFDTSFKKTKKDFGEFKFGE